MKQNTAIQNIISHYTKCYQPLLDSFLLHYNSLTLEEIIECVTIEKGNGPYLIDNPHYRRIRKKHLMMKKKKLLKIINDIQECENKTFDNLYKLIESAKVKYISSLINYDISLALGFKLGLKPEKVYLHSYKNNVYQSAKIMNKKIHLLVIEKEDINHDILAKKLQPYHIENLLCIYYKQIKQLYK